jgi:hypothetical protein
MNRSDIIAKLYFVVESNHALLFQKIDNRLSGLSQSPHMSLNAKLFRPYAVPRRDVHNARHIL